MTPAQALREAIESQLVSPPANVSVALSWLGGSKPELAARLAGTTDKRSSAYRNALRNVQRWAKGATPKGASWNAVKAALAPEALDRTIRRMGRRGVNVRQFDGEVYVSADDRERDVANVFIGGPTLTGAGFVRAALGGRWGEAASAFASAWGDSYGIGTGVSFGNVSELDLSWR